MQSQVITVHSTTISIFVYMHIFLLLFETLQAKALGYFYAQNPKEKSTEPAYNRLFMKRTMRLLSQIDVQ